MPVAGLFLELVRRLFTVAAEFWELLNFFEDSSKLMRADEIYRTCYKLGSCPASINSKPSRCAKIFKISRFAIQRLVVCCEFGSALQGSE